MQHYIRQCHIILQLAKLELILKPTLAFKLKFYMHTKLTCRHTRRPYITTYIRRCHALTRKFPMFEQRIWIIGTQTLCMITSEPYRTQNQEVLELNCWQFSLRGEEVKYQTLEEADIPNLQYLTMLGNHSTTSPIWAFIAEPGDLKIQFPQFSRQCLQVTNNVY